MVADRISRTSILSLIRVRPALVQRALPREASLTKTLLGALTVWDGIRADANITVTALHDGKVVSRTLLASILAVAKLEKSLGLPLPGSAPFGVAGEAHAEVFQGSGDCEHLFRLDVGRRRAFEHLEAASDLVECDLFCEGTVVPDVDVESACVAFDESIVDWSCCCRRGEQRSENPALGVHVCCSDCGSVSEM